MTILNDKFAILSKSIYALTIDKALMENNNLL